ERGRAAAPPLLGPPVAGHVETAAAVADRHAVAQDVPAETHRYVRVEGGEQAVAEDLACRDVWMAGAIDEVSVRVNARPVEGHEAALVAEDLAEIGEVPLQVAPAEPGRRGEDVGRPQAEPVALQEVGHRVGGRAVVVARPVRQPAAPGPGGLESEVVLAGG